MSLFRQNEVEFDIIKKTEYMYRYCRWIHHYLCHTTTHINTKDGAYMIAYVPAIIDTPRQALAKLLNAIGKDVQKYVMVPMRARTKPIVDIAPTTVWQRVSVWIMDRSMRRAPLSSDPGVSGLSFAVQDPPDTNANGLTW